MIIYNYFSLVPINMTKCKLCNFDMFSNRYFALYMNLFKIIHIIIYEF
jgi:hypothetical protein